MYGILELKERSGLVQDVDFKNRVVTGYFNNFNSIDSDGDVIRKGAGLASIARRKNKIYFLNQHDWKQPHGFANIIEEKESGTYFESLPMSDTTYSRDALILYQNGIIKEHSFGFQTLKANPATVDGKNVREITEYELFEFSNVTLGANSNTPFTGFKSGFKSVEDANLELKNLLNVFRNENISDDLGLQLEIAIKMLQRESFELGKQVALEEKQKQLEIDNSENKADLSELTDLIKAFKF